MLFFRLLNDNADLKQYFPKYKDKTAEQLRSDEDVSFRYYYGPLGLITQKLCTLTGLLGQQVIGITKLKLNGIDIYFDYINYNK